MGPAASPQTLCPRTSGDMLERFTNGTLRATPHRVLATPWERMSLIRFNGFESDTTVAPLPQFVTPDRPEAYSATTQGDHMTKIFARINAGLGAQATATM